MAGETCWEKVELALSALATTLTAEDAALEAWAVEAGVSRDRAVDPDSAPGILRIVTVAIAMQQSDEQHQTFHSQTVEFEFIQGNAAAGTLRMDNLRKAAALHAIIAADRTLGGRLHDMQEIDIAPADAGGKDVNGVSVQYEVQFFTPRANWLTIIGQAGVEY